MKQQRYEHVIWDWNGTLFDDVNWCMGVINTMLAKRGIQKLHGIADYHDVFCFPIIEYYRNVGFDFECESFEALAAEFIALYHSNKSGNCKLHINAETALSSIFESGVSQTILSASEINILMSQVSEFDIAGYFDEILGISDIYAKSKLDIGQDYIARKNIKNAVLIGDTKHDYEVAMTLGIDCILIPSGHQSKSELSSCGVPVLDDISCVPKHILA